MARFTGGVELPAVVGDDAPGFGEAQTQTAASLAGRIEGIEDVTAFLRLDARPIVA